MQRAKKISYVVALVFAVSAMSGISVAAPPPPDDTTPPQETPPPPQGNDMPQRKDMPQRNDQTTPQDQGAQNPSGSAQVTPDKLSTTATVVKVNTAKRQLLLKDDQGNQFKLDVPAQVSGFATIKKGDKISADYYSAEALSLKKTGAGQTSGGTIGTAEERVPGPLPGGVIAHTVKSTVQVVNVDKAANKLTVKLPNGDTDTIDVKDTAMQGDLDKIKKGDKITASYTEAIAIAVTPQGKQPT